MNKTQCFTGFEAPRDLEHETQNYPSNVDSMSSWKGCNTSAYPREIQSFSVYGMFEGTMPDRQMHCV